MRFALLGTKLGMTQIFDGDVVVPVTVVQTGPCFVTQVKTQAIDGYDAIQISYGPQKEHRMTKPMLGHFAKAGVSPSSHLQEIRISADEVGNYNVGDQLTVEGFTEGSFVDVTGTSKGKGFQGVMKRHNFEGFRATHGTHEYFRHGGSIGCRLTPGRVFKGKRMSGQMGNVQVTTQNLTLFRIDAEKNLLFIRGAVPGSKSGLVTVAAARKKTAQAA